MTNQDTAPRAPGVSRRAFAAGLMAVPAAGLITAVPIHAATTAADVEPGFVELADQFRALQAEQEAFSAAYAAPAREAAKAARVRWLEACEAIPHVTLPSPLPDNPTRTITTGNRMDMIITAALISACEPSPPAPEYVKLAQGEADRKAQAEALRNRFNLDALEARAKDLDRRSDEMSDQAYPFLSAALSFPATRLATLVAKLDLIKELGLEVEDDADNIAADVRRIAAGEARHG